MNIDPKHWGPSFWNTFHYISVSYSHDPNLTVQNNMKTFIQSIPTLLPCKECQDHAFSYIKNADVDKAVKSQMDLFTFFFEFHNYVNERLKKPQMSLETALKKYGVVDRDLPVYQLGAIVILLLLLLYIVK